jgi:hypothetical protein
MDSTNNPAGAALVVLNGRQNGTRRPLADPLTLIGRAANCEIRLNVDGVQPLHCAILLGSGGYLLRDLGGALLNGEPVQVRSLHDGDQLTVGPYLFRVDIPAQATAGFLDPAALQGEREALRIQAAAVAAQQTALTEQELRLEQRRHALEKQEQQLAEHLKERQRRLTVFRDQLHQQRDKLKKDRASEHRKVSESWSQVKRARGEVKRLQENTLREQDRLRELRERFKKKMCRLFEARGKELVEQAQQIEAEKERLRAEAESLRKDRTRLTEERMRSNGESELGRRQLRDGWDELRLSQQRWEECLEREQQERKGRIRSLEEQSAVVQSARQALSEEQTRWQRRLVHLQQDVQGLEARIGNQRAQLLILEHQARLHQPDGKTEEEPGAAAPEVRERLLAPEEVCSLAGLVTDQRLHLIEQWESAFLVHDAWREESQAAQQQLEVATQDLAQREHQIVLREQEQHDKARELDKQAEELVRARLALESWHSRLAIREADCGHERTRLVAEIQAREEAASLRSSEAELRRRRHARRARLRLDQIKDLHRGSEEVRLLHVSLWKDCQSRHSALLAKEQDVGRQAVVLEQFRQELMGQAGDPREAERRLERLKRDCLAFTRKGENELKRLGQGLQAERAQLDKHAEEFRMREYRLLKRMRGFLTRQERATDQQRQDAAARQKIDQEVQRLRIGHRRDEAQLQSLRDEIERMARLLMEDTPPPLEAERLTPPSSQAA